LNRLQDAKENKDNNRTAKIAKHAKKTNTKKINPKN